MPWDQTSDHLWQGTHYYHLAMEDTLTAPIYFNIQYVYTIVRGEVGILPSAKQGKKWMNMYVRSSIPVNSTELFHIRNLIFLDRLGMSLVMCVSSFLDLYLLIYLGI